MHQRDGALVGFFLVEELVLDRVEVDEVAHARARVPADVVRVHVDLGQQLDHLILICDVCLCTRRRGSKVCGVVPVVIRGGNVDGREGEAGGDLELSGLTVRSRWRRLQDINFRILHRYP